MFSLTNAGKAAPPPWIEVHSIPQDLIEGVIATFIGLVILFSIKPRLRIKLAEAEERAKGTTAADKQPSENFRFRVTNRRLRKVVEVKVQLLRIQGGWRHKIDLVYNELFELRGKWSPLKPAWRKLMLAHLTQLSLNGSNREKARSDIKTFQAAREKDKGYRDHYSFYPVRSQLEEEMKKLGEEDFILFQVIAKDVFTGFSRLKTKRCYKWELEEIAMKADARREQSSTASDQPPMARP